MSESKLIRAHKLFTKLEVMGFTLQEIEKLLRIQNTLRKWFLLECNGVVYRDENTDKPFFRVGCPMNKNEYAAKPKPARDLEKQATDALEKMITAHHNRNAVFPDDGGVTVHIQSDPRGCSLYAYNVSQLKGADITAVYSSIGVAVCI